MNYGFRRVLELFIPKTPAPQLNSETPSAADGFVAAEPAHDSTKRGTETDPDRPSHCCCEGAAKKRSSS